MASWYNSNRLQVVVFNVKRGLAMFLHLPNNLGIVLDLGVNEDFSPIDFINDNIISHLSKYNGNRSIAQLIVSHPHADHIAQAKRYNELSSIKTGLVTLPHDHVVPGQPDERVDFDRIENDDNKHLIEQYKKLYYERKPPLQTIDPDMCPPGSFNIDYGIYYMRPPEVAQIHQKSDQEYANGLSLCVFVRYGEQTLWVTGDVTPDVHKDILCCTDSIERRYTSFSTSSNTTDKKTTIIKTSGQPSPVELFNKYGLDLLVTPHHGLESGFSEDLFDLIPDNKTTLNIVSEKRHTTSSDDGSVDQRYSSDKYVRGTYVDIEGENVRRKMISTRNEHHILVAMGDDISRPKVYMRKNPKHLLQLT